MTPVVDRAGATGRGTVGAGLCAVVLLLTACAADQGESAGAPAPSPAAGGAATPRPEPTPGDAAPTSATDPPPPTDPAEPTAAPATISPRSGVPAFPDTTEPQLVAAPPRRSGLVFQGVRVSEHQDFDRLVVDLGGTGLPGWSVEYVPRPRAEGSGDTIRIDGDSVLQIVSSGTGELGPRYHDGPGRLRPENGGEVVDVVAVGTFEGYTQLFAGIRGPRAPFRVFALTDPSRLVVDIAH